MQQHARQHDMHLFITATNVFCCYFLFQYQLYYRQYNQTHAASFLSPTLDKCLFSHSHIISVESKLEQNKTRKLPDPIHNHD